MEIIKGEIDGLLVVKLDVFKDDRGFFVERYNEEKFQDNGLPTNFPQYNHSRSKPGVLRGLHYQHDPAQGKFVSVMHGKIWDVAVDIRPDSESYGKYSTIEISGDSGVLFWIPPGFAHGFCVLGDEDVDLVYHVTGNYNAAGEGGIIWNDPEIGIDWPLENPIISGRDQELMSFAEYKSNPVDWE